MNRYFVVENVYARVHNVEDAVLGHRQQHACDLDVVFSVARSHRALDVKDRVLLQLLGHLATPRPSLQAAAAFLPLLEQLANPKQNQYSLAALEARQLLVDHKMPSHRKRLAQVEVVVHMIIGGGEQPAELSASLRTSWTSPSRSLTCSSRCSTTRMWQCVSVRSSSTSAASTGRT